MTTPYRGQAIIGGCHADVDIANVDSSKWTGTATHLEGKALASPETIVKLLDQPRPGWSAHAEATVSPDGALTLQGTSHFNPERRVAPAKRSLWVPKVPRTT